MSFPDESSRPLHGHISQEGDIFRDSDTANKQEVHSPLAGDVPQPEDDEIIQRQSAKEDLRQSDGNEDPLVPAGQSAAQTVPVADQKRGGQEATEEPVADMPSRMTADGKPIPKNTPCPCGSRHKFKKCCGKKKLVVQSNPRDKLEEPQNEENDGMDKKDDVQAQDSNASATHDLQSLQTDCRICFEHHSYDSTCPEHGTFMCRECWTAHVKHELSLNPYHGCRCPFCRRHLNNDVVEELLPYQSHFQAAKSLDDLEEMHQAAQAISAPLPAIGSDTGTSFGPRFGRAQLSTRSWEIERAAEREERRVRFVRIMAARVEREARGREE